MHYNLENKNYKVNVQPIQQNGCFGTYLMAEKAEKYGSLYL